MGEKFKQKNWKNKRLLNRQYSRKNLSFRKGFPFNVFPVPLMHSPSQSSSGNGSNSTTSEKQRG